MADQKMASNAARVLAAVPYLADLDPAALEAVARAAVCRTYDADQIVFTEGELSLIHI